MAKYLVTGGAGFIGSHLVDALIARGGEVAVIDNFLTGKKANLNLAAELHQFNICDLAKIKPLFKGVQGVFHLAAIPSVPLSVADPAGTTLNNAVGAVNVFTAAKEAGVQRVIFASSSAVYGDQAVLPVKETMAPQPSSPYGLQKLEGEWYAKLFGALYNLPIISLRFFNVYGPRLDLDSDYASVLGKFIKQKKSGQPLTIFGDGRQTRSFVYVNDVVRALLLAFDSSRLSGGEVINISGQERNTINELAALIGGEIKYLPPRAGDILHSFADISLAKKYLDWEPKISLAEGVALITGA